MQQVLACDERLLRQNESKRLSPRFGPPNRR